MTIQWSSDTVYKNKLSTPGSNSHRGVWASDHKPGSRYPEILNPNTPPSSNNFTKITIDKNTYIDSGHLDIKVISTDFFNNDKTITLHYEGWIKDIYGNHYLVFSTGSKAHPTYITIPPDTDNNTGISLNIPRDIPSNSDSFHWHEIYGGDIDTCFLRHSLIETPHGYVCIEDIHAGDEIITYNGGIRKETPVIFVGSGFCFSHIKTEGGQERYPIRILKNALALGRPFKDLLVTEEHCLFLSGGFVPVRMLVNGMSIFYDKSFPSYNYFHIETCRHSIINANGIFTETYLDTGNRKHFSVTERISRDKQAFLHA